MIRPEMLAIEGKCAAGERNLRQIFDLWSFLTQIKLCNCPALAVLFGPAQQVDHPIDKCVAGNLRPSIDGAQDISRRIQFQDSMLIPLAEVNISPVVTEI